MSLAAHPNRNLLSLMEICEAKEKSRTPENPLHTYEPATVASFRTWRGLQDYVARDRCPTLLILSKDFVCAVTARIREAASIPT
jgi:hypothetical protein